MHCMLICLEIVCVKTATIEHYSKLQYLKICVYMTRHCIHLGMLIHILEKLDALLNTNLELTGYNKLPVNSGDKPCRILNNMIKKHLIVSHVHADNYFLDLPCGSGNDVAKLEQIQIRKYIGIDIDFNDFLLNAAKQRPSVIALGHRCILHRGNMCSPSLFHDLGLATGIFHVVSCQFAMHYAFESQSSAENFVTNVTTALRPNGVFIATFPDCEHLLQCWKDNHPVAYQNKYITITPPTEAFTDADEYGIKYHFKQTECVNDYEFLIRRRTLEKLFTRCGMRLVQNISFKDFCEHPDTSQTFKGEYQKLDEDNKQIFHIYRYAIFQKNS